MVKKSILKEVLIDQREFLEDKKDWVKREILNKVEKYLEIPHIIVISGLRRVGKSTLLKQIIEEYYKNEPFYFVNFEDERLIDFKVSDFNNLNEVLIELYGDSQTYFFDEIQTVSNWERFVRRLYDLRNKIFITGSSASLLEREIGSKLTGRYLHIELLPFSFAEYLKMKNVKPDANWHLRTKDRALIRAHFNSYIKEGGMPEYIKYGEKELLQRLYKDVIFRDIVTKHNIRNVDDLRDLSLYIVSNAGSLFTYSSLQRATNINNVMSVKNYVNFLKDSYLLFVVKGYSYSVKKQNLSPKKIFIIDNGIRDSIGFSFSENRGQYLEHIVFLELKRKNKELYYYQTRSKKEIDFLIHTKNEPETLIQVTTSLHDREVENREISTLTEGMKELGIKKGLILTEEDEKMVDTQSGNIQVYPISKWLLSP